MVLLKVFLIAQELKVLAGHSLFQQSQLWSLFGNKLKLYFFWLLGYLRKMCVRDVRQEVVNIVISYLYLRAQVIVSDIL